MRLKIGETAPLFDLPSTDGKIFSLENQLDKLLVIYFYPKDFTKGCIKEACTFRDQWNTFNDLSINIIGISTDPLEQHFKFRERYHIPFHLLSDEKGDVCKLYDAWIPFVNIPKRTTFVLEKKLIISGIFSNMFMAKKHVTFSLDKMRKGREN